MRRTIVVTGASRGIGLAIAQSLLADRAQVTAIQRTISAELRALEENYADTFRLVQGDCTDESTIQRAIQETRNSFGAIHGLVFNAAATVVVGTIAELPLDAWQQTFDVNVFGVIKFLRHALPVTEDDARVVFVSSAVSEEITFKATGPYSASKAALNSLNRTLAVEQPGKVCVAVHPGSVNTVMRNEFLSKAKPYGSESELRGGEDIVIEPEDPGRAIASLALRAPRDLSGRYIRWDDPVLSRL
ncbi:NAD(P)-binding protein [Auricularia subglabra TFB-10046 SS5]|nr:NAD(P)-binding protein [Auricularia subglabra TFB-10046 SS5]